MSKRPPDGEGPDDPWQELLREVQTALDDHELSDTVDGDLLNDALLTGLQQAFRQLGELTGAGDDVMRSAEDMLRKHRRDRTENGEGPGVTIVQGGRDRDEPPTPGERPHLRVATPAATGNDDDLDLDGHLEADDDAGGVHDFTGDLEPDDDLDLDDDDDGEPDTPGDVRSRVRILRLGGKGRLGQNSTRVLPTPGTIRLADRGDTQTVFRGGVPRAYRVFAKRGALLLRLNGQPADRVGPGQSVDVEAQVIRVQAVDDGGAAGSYERLPVDTAAPPPPASPEPTR